MAAVAVAVGVDVHGDGAARLDVQALQVGLLAELVIVLLDPDGVVREDAVGHASKDCRDSTSITFAVNEGLHIDMPQSHRLCKEHIAVLCTLGSRLGKCPERSHGSSQVSCTAGMNGICRDSSQLCVLSTLSCSG